MRHAIKLVFLAACAALALTPASSRAKSAPLMNAVGLIDYSAKPDFKPGDWVSYHVTGANDQGEEADYFVTVLIAGEEKFWGEDCFWVETRTRKATATAPVVVATLMSYSAFDDSLPSVHMKMYMRKSITEISDEGVPREELIRRPLTTLKRREQSEHTTWLVDSLGRDTVQVPRSVFQCAKLKLEEGVAATADYADSSTRTEVRDTRWVYMTPVVPITHLAREKIENSVKHKSWLIGHSQEGTPMLLVGLSQGDARLVDYGTGLESGLVPAKFRKSFREQEAAGRVAPPRPKAKRAS